MSELASGTVTFLFTDIEGSTRLWQDHPLAMKAALARHDEILREAIEGRGGHVVKTTGDGFHAAFVAAHDAIDAAVAAQRALAQEQWGETGPLLVRMGVHTCEAESRDGDYYGSGVNRAARLMAVAHGGQIVVSLASSELARDSSVGLLDLGKHRLRDLAHAEQLFQVVASGLVPEFPPLRSVGANASNLPRELSHFVGRNDEVRQLRRLLGDSRVVTVVGVGGVGKTRVALRTASEVLPEYPDGVWLCELAAARAPEDVLDGVAAAVRYVPAQGTKLADGLPRFLEHKSLLIVLDNCEHLIRSAAMFVAETLPSAGGVSVLATSRDPLGVPGERVFRLASMSLPIDDDPESVLASEAGSLFALRAQEARGGLPVNGDNSAAIRELCVRLDGIPLAIELAAARAIAMSPREIADRLDRQLRLLAGGSRTALERHETLRAAVNWSYELLADGERRLFQHCSTFVGDFDLEAAMAIGAGIEMNDVELIDTLGSLVRQSLVERMDRSTGTRYRLLEMVRQCAAEHFEATGEVSAARDLHAVYYTRLAVTQFERALSPSAWEALDTLEQDLPNLTAAGMWLLDRGKSTEVLQLFHDLPFVDPVTLPAPVAESLGRLAAEALAKSADPSCRGWPETCFMAAMRHFIDGDTSEYRRCSDMGATAPGPLSARLLLLQASVATFDGAAQDARSLCTRALDAARTTATNEELAFAHAFMSVLERAIAPHAAVEMAQKGISLARESRSPIPTLYPLLALAFALEDINSQAALAAAEECLSADHSQRRTWASGCRTVTARVRYQAGHVAHALHDLRDSLTNLIRDGDRYMLSVQIGFLADTIADTAPSVALQVGAIAESAAIASTQPFSYRPPLALLADLHRDELERARAVATTMSYPSATSFVLDAIDQLLEEFSES